MKRTRQINVKLSDEEFEMLDAVGSERGLDRSATLRHLITRDAEASKYLTPLQADAALGNAMKTRRRRLETR